MHKNAILSKMNKPNRLVENDLYFCSTQADFNCKTTETQLPGSASHAAHLFANWHSMCLHMGDGQADLSRW